MLLVFCSLVDGNAAIASVSFDPVLIRFVLPQRPRLVDRSISSGSRSQSINKAIRRRSIGHQCKPRPRYVGANLGEVCYDLRGLR